MSVLANLTTQQIVNVANIFLPKPVKNFRSRKEAEQRLQEVTRGVPRIKLIDAFKKAKISSDIIEKIPPMPKNPKLTQAERKEEQVVEKEQKKHAKEVRKELRQPNTQGAAVLVGLRQLVSEYQEKEVSSGDLATHLRTSPTAVCKAIEHLSKLGLVRFEDDSPSDEQKFYYVKLTEDGRLLWLAPVHADSKQAIAEVPASASPAHASKAVKKILPSDKSGPVSKFNGKKLYKLVDGNPRREGTHGWKSFAMIKNGMTFEDYRKAGGRNNDLAWDIEHKFVEVK